VRKTCQFLFLLSVTWFYGGKTAAQHQHPAPERLGSVKFTTSCHSAVQPRFNRAVALLHSFAYDEAAKEFQNVASEDQTCAMAYWGAAMSYYHQLWEPTFLPGGEEKGRAEITKALTMKKVSPRESGFISAVAALYSNSPSVPLRDRMLKYEDGMGRVASQNPDDPESQVFYALALLSVAPLTDKTHANQKKALAILEPLYAKYPQHPGIAHYLIHACDNAEMAGHGLQAARDYSLIAPSAPHALHMPSHIFTRLGMWNDSVQSNLAARKAAHEHGDLGEELHAMDYLMYAYLQLGRDPEATGLLADLKNLLADLKKKMTDPPAQEFKVSYAATAMPVRFALERGRWSEAAELQPLAAASPQVSAVSVWASALGCAHQHNVACAKSGMFKLAQIERGLRAAGNHHWADQVAIQVSEVSAWIALSSGDPRGPRVFMSRAADMEDGLEKLPLTPGPILPAREQLGEILVGLKQPAPALKEFETSLKQAPGRRNSLAGALQAAQQSDQRDKVKTYQSALSNLSQPSTSTH